MPTVSDVAGRMLTTMSLSRITRSRSSMPLTSLVPYSSTAAAGWVRPTPVTSMYMGCSILAVSRPISP
ncbi:hypothetical protein ABL78_8591 [Leptomonas seymouri]|uniref:Uncharacterized protein n=1 Tax=Leptomonas seymouri TaxID=5684 RepID=A0A0N0P209_LEPSE|nr:hypothetical protein ABL78_8591 [Leptomonas seymouri]|eukprot:KPI82399.1 hypothetical protein ABL78_8591 [Leptomonas seymouri]